MFDYLTAIMTGLFTGFGSTIGNYFAMRHLIQRLDKDNNVKK